TSSIHEEDVSSNMVMTDDAHVTERHESLTSNLVMTQALPTINPQSVSSIISFQQEAGRVQEVNVTDPITFVELVTRFVNVGEHIPLSHDLGLTDAAEVTGLSSLVDSEMTLTQSVVARGPINAFFQHRMSLQSFMPREDRFERLTDTVEFIQGAGYPHEENVTTSINMSDEAYWSETPSSNMSLVQNLDAGKSQDVLPSELGLTQIALVNGVWDRSLSDTLDIGHTLTYYLPDPCDDKAYTPFIGESTDSFNPTPPEDELDYIPRLPDGERFLLLYPAMGESTDIVELRAPNLDNRDRQSFTRINRETRGGRLTIFADPTWPKIQALVLSFSGLTKTEVDDVQQFMVDHIGKEVGIIDWEGTQWVGIITTPSERAVQDGRGCQWTITFEFEGVILEELPPGSQMNMTDSQSMIIEWHRSLEDAMYIQQGVQETVVSP
ncbi:MAG: hypothetical protein ACW97A_11390, partial [Candidatus Thorarchaeota archaeon]